MSEHGAVILCCCDRGVGADEVCDLWADCVDGDELPASYSFVAGYSMRWPDGSNWTWGNDSKLNFAFSASGTLTRSTVAQNQFDGWLYGTFSGTGEMPFHQASGSNVWWNPEGFPPPDQGTAPWWPDCSRACENFKAYSYSFSGTCRIWVGVNCIGIPNSSGFGFDMGTGATIGIAQLLSGTLTVTDHLVPSASYTTTDVSTWPFYPVNDPLGDIGFDYQRRGCPQNTWGSYSEQVNTEEIRMCSLYGTELNNPPWFEVICNTCEGDQAPICGDKTETRFTDWNLSIG